MKLVIDTDAGGDDAVAILLALNAVDKVQVIAITCTYGNTDEANVELNVLKILTVAGRSDVSFFFLFYSVGLKVRRGWELPDCMHGFLLPRAREWISRARAHAYVMSRLKIYV